MPFVLSLCEEAPHPTVLVEQQALPSPAVGRGRSNRRRDSDAVRLEHDPEKWEPVFGKRSCSSKKLDFDPIQSNRIKVYLPAPRRSF